MVSSGMPVSDAAREAVQDIGEPHPEYRVELVQVFSQALQIIRSEPTEIGQKRATESLVKILAAQTSERLGE